MLIDDNPYLAGLTTPKPVIADPVEFMKGLATVTAPQQQASKNVPLQKGQVKALGKGSYNTDASSRAERRAEKKKAQQLNKKYAPALARTAARKAANDAAYKSDVAVQRRYAGFWHALRRSAQPRGCLVMNYMLRPAVS